MHKFKFNDNEIKKVSKNLNVLKDKLKIKITVDENIVTIEGEQYDEYMAKDVMEALSLGFSVRDSLSLLNENRELKVLNLKGYVNRHALNRVISRIIGKEGRAKRKFEGLTNTHICIHESKVGIIGEYDDVELAVNALLKLINGSPHNNVYYYIEKKNLEKVKT